MTIEDSPYKFISGMGMSIGHFICGTIKQKCNEKNLNRYLQMEPFPFTNSTDNARHRESMIKKPEYSYLYLEILMKTSQM